MGFLWRKAMGLSLALALLLGFVPQTAVRAVPAPDAGAEDSGQDRGTGLAALPSTQKLTVNGAAAEARHYNLDGRNYFSLRDLAMLLNGTPSQFSVDYDGAAETVLIHTGQAYAPVGGELDAGEALPAVCAASTQRFCVDGVPAELPACNIDGSNYLQLRALGAALGFRVDYDGDADTVRVSSAAIPLRDWKAGCAAAAAELEQEVLACMEKYRLTDANFGMGFYDTASGFTWYYNENAWFIAGSLFKLPVNMVYGDLLAAGELGSGDIVGGYRLSDAMYLSMVYSNNEAAQAIKDALGNNLIARNRMARYSGIPIDQLPREYYTENRMSPHYMLETLKCLYDGRERYSGIIEQMTLASPDHYFRAAPSDYVIAHKYGALDGWTNDCGIVYTPQPFLLVVFQRRWIDQPLAELCAIATRFALRLDALGSGEGENAAGDAEWETAEAAPEGTEAV